MGLNSWYFNPCAFAYSIANKLSKAKKKNSALRIADIRNTSYVFLGNQVYIGGLNDVWDFTSVVLSKASTGVYTGTATIIKASTYGMKIYIDQSWNRYFGGSFTSLRYLGSNITSDQSLANGNYDVTVDFINNTCTF